MLDYFAVNLILSYFIRLIQIVVDAFGDPQIFLEQQQFQPQIDPRKGNHPSEEIK